MPVSVAMYAKSYENIASRLDALGLDLDVITFGDDGKFVVQGRQVEPSDVDIDYLWLSPELSLEGGLAGAFQLALGCRSIKVMQTFNAGLDAPAYSQIAAKGVRICNSSAQAVAISEYILAQVLAVFQPLAQQRALQADKQWQRTPFREISRTNWLIVGYGPIGKATAVRANAFGATVTVVRRSLEAGPEVAEVKRMADLPEILPNADVIVLACPLNDTTRGFADDAFFNAVKPGSVLVNIARGGLVEDAAMIRALDDGRLAKAVLDVFHTEPLPADNPLWSHPNIHLTSHTSFSGSGVRTRWEELFLDNIARFARGEALVNEVNPKELV